MYIRTQCTHGYSLPPAPKKPLKFECLFIHHFVASHGVSNQWANSQAAPRACVKAYDQAVSPLRAGGLRPGGGWCGEDHTESLRSVPVRSSQAPRSVLCLLNEQSCFLSTHKPNCLSNCSHLLWVQICTARHELGCKLCRKQPSHPSVMSESSSTMWPGRICKRKKYIGSDSFPMRCDESPPSCFWPSVESLNMIEVMPGIFSRAELISKGAGN